MEFGKLSDVEGVNWELPPTDPLAFKGIPPQSPSTQFYLGAPAWGHRVWVGKFYPDKTKPSEFLREYAIRFNTIELNTTHYRVPSLQQAQEWADETPAGFLFCPKIFQGISHQNAGLLDTALLKDWLVGIGGFGEKLGPSFLQLPPYFDYSRKTELFRFLQAWPNSFKLALEFRHPSWFENKCLLPALTEYLQGRGIGAVITDVAGRRDVLHASVTAPFTLIRFIANDLHRSDFSRCEAWAKRLGEWRDQGLQQAFFIIHEPDDVMAPEMGKEAITMLNLHAQAQLHEFPGTAQLNWEL